MNALCVVPCGKSKIWDRDQGAGPTKARDVYTGPFARRCKEYAETLHPTSWCILSARYGFLFPDDIVPGPYNVTFNRKRSGPITLEQLRAQVPVKNLDSFSRIVVLGGRDYVKMLRQLFPDTPIDEPLAGCKGIGHMMRRIGELLRAHRTQEQALKIPRASMHAGGL